MHRCVSCAIFAVVVASAAAAAQPAKDFAGRVVNEKGQPVSGAEVKAVFNADNAGNAKDTQTVSTFTGADGAFRFQGGKVPGAVVATKRGKCLDWADLSDIIAGDPVLRLGPASVIEGDVVDDAAKPLAGASVSVLLRLELPASKQMHTTISVEPLMTKTDARGHFRFAAIPAQATMAFEITSPGKARALAEGHFMPGQKGLRLVLAPQGRIDGTVVENATGRPLVGVSVRAMGSLTSGIQFAWARTDKAGNFGFAGLSAGHYEIEIDGSGKDLPEWVGSQNKVQVHNGQTASAKIETVKGGVLEVVLVDSATKKPASTASGLIGVSLAQNLGTFNTCLIHPDGTGKFCLAPGKYIITQMMSTGYSWTPAKEQTFAVEAGKTTRAAIAVTPMPQMTLAVLDPSGKPVPAAMAQLWTFDGKLRCLAADAKGRLVVSSADVGPLFCFVLVRHPKENLAALVAVSKDEKPPQVVLEPLATVAGTVRDVNRRPIPGASVHAQIDASHMGRYAIIATAQTDKDGRYRIDLPQACGPSYAISARAPGYSVAETLLTANQMVGGPGVKDLELKTANRGLPGVVLDEQGKRVAGAVITARSASGLEFPLSAVSDSKGRFALEQLSDDPEIFVSAKVPGRGWIGDKPVKPGDKDVVITVGQPYWD